MDSFLIFILMIMYFIWITIFIFKFKINSNEYIYIDEEINNLIEKIYIDAISFEKCMAFTKALQRNLNYQIDSFMRINFEEKELMLEYLDCIKDNIDINDMTFYTGNEIIDMLLRKKVRECRYRNITLDVVADLSEVDIDENHLFLIISDLIDLAIKYIVNRKDENGKPKIIIRAAKENIEGNDFFIMQLAYNAIDGVEDRDINEYVNRYHNDAVNSLLDHYNGIVASDHKGKNIVKTIVIPLQDVN